MFCIRICICKTIITKTLRFSHVLSLEGTIQKTMKKNIFIAGLAALSFASCQKNVENIVTNTAATKTEIAPAKTTNFIKYTIPKGEQYCDKSIYEAVTYQQLSFIVRFDSSAIYKTIAASNQDDINKLFGFSDNNAQHHDFSARFGWRWSDNALRLFGYIYNNGTMSNKELGTVEIGTENSCSIKVEKGNYIFSLNGNETTMPRASTTAEAEGYKLYPYFGGDELAPHTITIWIEEL